MSPAWEEELVEAEGPSRLLPVSQLVGSPAMQALEESATTAVLQRAYPELARVTVRDIDVGEHATARLYRSSGPAASPLLAWVHGGAFVVGDLEMPEANWVGLAVAAAGIHVLSLDYRKAVGGITYPAPNDDVRDGWRRALDEGRQLGGGSVYLGGASAGASLAASVTLKLRDEGEVMPSGVALAYPTLHSELPLWRRDQLTAIRVKAGAAYLSSAWVREMGENYRGDGGDDAGKYAFPGERELSGLPPHLVMLAEYDTLRTSGESYIEALIESSVETACFLVEGSRHGFLNDPFSESGKRGLFGMIRWIREHDAGLRE